MDKKHLFRLHASQFDCVIGQVPCGNLKQISSTMLRSVEVRSRWLLCLQSFPISNHSHWSFSLVIHAMSSERVYLIVFGQQPCTVNSLIDLMTLYLASKFIYQVYRKC